MWHLACESIWMVFRFIILIIYYCESSSADSRVPIWSPSSIYTWFFSFARFLLPNNWMHHVWVSFENTNHTYMYNLHARRWCWKQPLAWNPRRLSTPFNNLNVCFWLVSSHWNNWTIFARFFFFFSFVNNATLLHQQSNIPLLNFVFQMFAYMYIVYAVRSFVMIIISLWNKMKWYLRIGKIMDFC